MHLSNGFLMCAQDTQSGLRFLDKVTKMNAWDITILGALKKYVHIQYNDKSMFACLN